MSAPADNDSGTVDRVVSLLRLVAESDGVMSIRSVSQALSLAPSTVHRLLEKLAAHDLVFHDKAIHRYRLGAELYRMGCVIVAGHPLASLAEPILQGMTQQSGEVSILGLLFPKQRKMMFTAKVDPNNQLRYRIELNRYISLVNGASGRSILAFLSEEDIGISIAQELQERGSAASRLKTTRDIHADLAQIQTNGYALSHSSRIAGAVGIAVPVYGGGGKVMGSLCITIPEQRYEPKRLDALLAVLKDGSQKLSKTLGAPAASAARSS